MARKYAVVGSGDDVTTCDCCGRTNLKATVALDTLDADGGMTGEVVHFGKVCASRALGWGDSKQAGERVWGKALVAERHRKGAAIGKALRAAWADKLPKSDDLVRCPEVEAAYLAKHPTSVRVLAFVRRELGASDPHPCFVAPSDFNDGVHKGTGEHMRAYAARTWLRGLVHAHLDELHKAAHGYRDTSFDEHAVFRAALAEDA